MFKIASFTGNTRGNKKLMIAIKIAFWGPAGGRRNKANYFYHIKDSKRKNFRLSCGLIILVSLPARISERF